MKDEMQTGIYLYALRHDYINFAFELHFMSVNVNFMHAYLVSIIWHLVFPLPSKNKKKKLLANHRTMSV